MDARDDRDGLRRRLREAFAWRGPEDRADLSSWWADPSLLAALGPALAGLHPRERITTVLAPESTGFDDRAATSAATRAARRLVEDSGSTRVGAGRARGPDRKGAFPRR